MAVGLAAAGICAGFVIQRIARDWPQARAALASAHLGWVFAAALLAAAGMSAIAVAWRSVLVALGRPEPVGLVVRWYFAGEIGKYVPGGIWPIVGRAELARRGRVPRGVAYGSVVLSLALLYLAAAVVVAVLLPFRLSDVDPAVRLVLFLPPIGLALLHPALLERLLRVAVRSAPVRVPRFREALALVARYLIAWMLIGGATFAVARALTPDAAAGRIWFATALSWLIGFLAVPVPGGVGVREAVFMGAVGSLGPGVAPAVAVSSRLVFVAVDALAAVVSARAIGRGRLSREVAA